MINVFEGQEETVAVRRGVDVDVDAEALMEQVAQESGIAMEQALENAPLGRGEEVQAEERLAKLMEL